MKPHLSETNFRRFEADLAGFLSEYPKVYEIDPARYGMSVNTCAARLRDAKASLKANSWKTTADSETFYRNYQDIRVIVFSGKVYLGTQASWSTYIEANLTCARSSQNVFTVDLANARPEHMYETLCTFSRLAESQAFSGAIRFVNTPVYVFSSEWPEKLIGHYDIGLTTNPEKQEMLLL